MSWVAGAVVGVGDDVQNQASNSVENPGQTGGTTASVQTNVCVGSVCAPVWILALIFILGILLLVIALKR